MRIFSCLWLCECTKPIILGNWLWLKDYFIVGVCVQAKGILQELEVGESGHATFQFSNKQLKVWDLIGRSLIIHKGSQMKSVNNRLALHFFNIYHTFLSRRPSSSPVYPFYLAILRNIWLLTYVTFLTAWMCNILKDIRILDTYYILAI